MDRKNTNDDLKVRIEAVVNKMSIGDVYKTYVIDILIRRAKTFSFTEAQIQTDLDTISKSLVDIRFMPIAIDTLGQYYPKEKKIGLNFLTVLVYSNKATYQILAHEVYHALTHNELKFDRLRRINKYTGFENYTLSEICVEEASYKSIYSKASKNPYFDGKSTGYNDMMFINGMLEAAYGISKKELLKHSIQSREDFIEFLSQKSGQSTKKEAEFLDTFELNCGVIHEALYYKHIKNFLKNGKNIQMALAQMEALCAEKIRDRLVFSDYDSLNTKAMEDFQYDYNKLYYIMKKLNLKC